MTSVLPKMPAATRLLRLESTDSTNSEARRRAEAGERGPLWVWSLRQSAGRGRQGRSWFSDRGNLFASLLLTLGCPLATATQLSLLTGVAAYDAVEALIAGTGRPELASALRLKWPNDLLLGPAKLGGILIETALKPAETSCAVILGFGLNLAHHPEDLPRPATSLAAEGIDVAPDAALEALAAAMAVCLEAWGEGADFNAVRQAWLRRAGPLGQEISVKLPNETLAGIFDGLDVTGALRLKSKDGTCRRIAAGEVFFP